MIVACDHSVSHTGGARLLRQARQLQLVLICDGCGSERAQLGRIDYAPSPRRLVGHLAELTGRELGLDEEHVARVRFAALVCDIGREQISSQILNKQGALTAAEWSEVRRQPELAAALLSDAASTISASGSCATASVPTAAAIPAASSPSRFRSRRGSWP